MTSKGLVVTEGSEGPPFHDGECKAGMSKVQLFRTFPSAQAPCATIQRGAVGEAPAMLPAACGGSKNPLQAFTGPAPAGVDDS